jgi:hypothetical protein
VSDKTLPIDENSGTGRVVAAKYSSMFKLAIEELFHDAGKAGFRVTPDEVMDLIDQTLQEFFDRSVEPEIGATRVGRPPRIDVVAARQKIHLYAVNVYYRTYFPRKAGMEGKQRRGAPRLSEEYLERIRQLSKKGWNPAQIATELGQSDPGAVDRISKQMEIADERWSEIVADFQRRGQDQFAAAALNKPKLRDERPHQHKPRTKPRSSRPK